MNKGFLFATSSWKIKIHAVESQITVLILACLSLTLFIFIRTRSLWLSLSVFIVFPNFRLICSYFVPVSIVIFDLTLHICLYISSCVVFLADYGWFEGKVLYFNTQIHVYHILFTDGTTDYAVAEDFDGIDLILLQSFFWACVLWPFLAHLCQVSIDLINWFLTVEAFWVLVSSLVIVLKLFLIFR